MLLLMSAAYSYSQDETKRTIGLTALVQGQEFGIQIPIWLGSDITIAPSFEVKFVQNQGTDIIVGIVPKFYLNMKNKLTPYIGLKIGAAIDTPSGTGTTDIIAGVAFGGEYFFDSHFSIGVEAQANYTKSGINSFRFGNPDGSNFNTASVVTANIYF